MNNLVILYASIHHKNTEKLLKEIVKNKPVDLIDLLHEKNIELSKYQVVGFASGIYYSKLHKSIYKYIEENKNIPKKSFVIYTAGMASKKTVENFINYLEERGFEILGAYNCKGYDTYGPFKIIGGVAKGHPNEKDVEKGKEFLDEIVNMI
ncbi:flavodoxin domain-containing protein [Miniphocaeibacter halophilus]|uniref:Flavodoxin n=1 Tax=Miniphocaeibacter halophilus TaxID=2931922 RepID=A0AC61MR71_9FIRM|nr:flavodoxin domain-containing protein [Miniphocaeibacter halophilus]QQK06949.1 flavodoxin [Miniphocaeibacter halophilus]